MSEDEDALIEAVGKASEALEYVERARGHLYSFHQLLGRADIEFGKAADLLEQCGDREGADRMQTEVVGRNVLDGRWTFQVIEEFDDLYYSTALSMVRGLERDHLDGRRHVFEARMKEDRRSAGTTGHESRPPAAHAAEVDLDPDR